MPFERFSFIAGALCQTGDRYLRAGYKEQTMTVPEVVRAIGARSLAGGVEIHHRGNEDEASVAELQQAMSDFSIRPTFVNTWTYGERQWRFGSLSAADAATRREASGKRYLSSALALSDRKISPDPISTTRTVIR